MQLNRVCFCDAGATSDHATGYTQLEDAIFAYRHCLVVAGVRCAGRGRKIWGECVKADMDELGMHSEWVVFRDMWRSFILGKTSYPS